VYNAGLPTVTESYLHGQKVQSQFRKHAYTLQYVFYGLIVAAICFGLFQAGRTLVAGAVKLSILAGKQQVVHQYYQASQAENRQLAERIRIYSAPAGIEELARNNLEMVGEDEILVRAH
jgi:cell division protein FtsB